MSCISDIIDFLNLIPSPPNINDLIQPTDQQCLNIFGLIQNGTPLFQNPLASEVQDCLNEITQAIGIVNGFAPGTVKTDALNVLNNVSNAIGASPGGFLNHTNALSAQLGTPGFLNGVSACLGVRSTAGSLLNTANACLDLDDILGSILGSGAELVNNVVDAIQPLLDAVAAGVAAVASVIAAVIAAVIAPLAALASKLANELSSLSSIVEELEQFSLANSLCNLTDDPCMQAIFNATGTPALLNALPDLPRFP